MSDELFQEARTAHHSGDAALARELYARVLHTDPTHFRALHNLGSLCEDADDREEAERYYQRAMEAAPAEALPRYNLARSRHLSGDLDGAEPLYRQAIERDARLTEAHFNLGRLLQERGEPLAAEASLRTAVNQDDSQAGHHSRLGDALFTQGRLLEALVSYARVLDIDPKAAAAHYDLGKALESMAQGEQALECYRRALDLEPRSDATREGYARVLARLERRGELMAFLETWRADEPGRGYAEHLIASFGGAPAPERASDGYVRGLFDRFASGFDATLERLDYRAPHLVTGAVALHLGEPGGDRVILDAGCGTGLCAPLIRPWASRLDGVDLSPGMLERARIRGGYDALFVAELTEFLVSHPGTYDAIVSADTFCYLGPLDAVTRASAAALRPGGLLVFTVELCEASTHELGDHGRYKHSAAHVCEALAAAGFASPVMALGTLRREGGEPVEGSIVSALLA